MIFIKVHSRLSPEYNDLEAQGVIICHFLSNTTFLAGENLFLTFVSIGQPHFCTALWITQEKLKRLGFHSTTEMRRDAERVCGPSLYSTPDETIFQL